MVKFIFEGVSTMKKIEIIIPHKRVVDVREILRIPNTGGMSHYRIKGRRCI
jgi:hypothetical protein